MLINLKIGRQISDGHYIDADKADTISVLSVDILTEKRRSRRQLQYKPLRTGGWKYYNVKGELIKQETYVNGKLSDGEK